MIATTGRIALLTSALAVTSYPALAAEENAPLAAVVKCRAISDDRARVACYDQAVAAFQQAEKRGDVILVERRQIRETKQKLFGLTLPRTALLGRLDNGEEISQLDGKIASAQITGSGWLVRLADGSVWRQSDDVELGRRLQAGMQVTIRRAALGSFRLTIPGAAGFKVRREQ